MYEYLASPYSHPDENVVHRRFVETLQATRWCLTNGIIVFSPIVHCHQMSVAYGLPKNYEFWKNYDEAMIQASTGIIVLLLDGWSTSEGLSEERLLAERLKKPVRFIMPIGHTYDLFTKPANDMVV